MVLAPQLRIQFVLVSPSFEEAIGRFIACSLQVKELGKARVVCGCLMDMWENIDITQDSADIPTHSPLFLIVHSITNNESSIE